MKVCVTVDMDNYAEYASLVDPAGAADGPSFYGDAIPRFLDLFERTGIRATFFAVGRDAAQPENRRLLREIAARGHEIGNHSFHHPYRFRRLSRAQREKEIAQTEDVIADALGERPVGFRTPSGELDLETLRLLAERGYAYESCIFPTPILWAFMLYGKLFVRRDDYGLGEIRAVFAPPVPYVPSAGRLHRRRRPGDPGAPPIVEIPISVVPGLRIPFYMTLLRRLGERAFDRCVRAYGTRKPALHLIMHLIDLVDLEGSSLGRALARSPGLAVPFARRERFVTHAMETLAGVGECVPLRELAREARAAEGLDA